MRLLPVVLLLIVPLTGCDQFEERATRREVLKLAYRTSQFQEALERCEAPPEVLQQHQTQWEENFVAAAKWLEVEPDEIANRQKAGRDALGEDTELGCEVVLKATKISFAAADRWSARIEDGEYCTLMGCD